MSVIGLDIGGANLKGAHSEGKCVSRVFPLWESPELLGDALHELLRLLPWGETIAVTMTGELADCFSTKREGVRRILEGVGEVAQGRPILVWSTRGKFLSVVEACESPLDVAAANWHAVARWWGITRQIESGMLIDIGSTTTDLIPIRERSPSTRGVTDVGRLKEGELLYTGAWRTPLCAVCPAVPFRQAMVSLAAEWFSTTADVALLLGNVPEQSDNLDTANHQPATREHAWDRIARQICCDRTECSLEEALEIAKFVRETQLSQIRKNLEQVWMQFQDSIPASRHVVPEILLSGSGRYLGGEVLRRIQGVERWAVVDLGEVLSADLAVGACAYAVAQLALENQA